MDSTDVTVISHLVDLKEVRGFFVVSVPFHLLCRCFGVRTFRNEWLSKHEWMAKFHGDCKVF